ncbi:MULTISPECIES: hypothetical protein [unclassified Xanthomonas]|uniref:hypothetical protein n=1 Tax=unclassified Xanthomonas TaxID=2643310 RepID=UPI002A812043|nr:MULTISPECIES: hypothetical protein [unclassified Xanthomonas]MDY4296790.1 hypothetical protein [Xanthomonas sp. LF02-5]MDY4358451.1 hypothetical protein [Xanthomonas sp. LF04-12]
MNTTLTPEALGLAIAAAREAGEYAELPSRVYDALVAGWQALRATPSDASMGEQLVVPAHPWVSVTDRLPTEEDYGDHEDVLVRFRYTDTPGRAWTIGESSYLPGDPWNNGWLFGSCDYAEVSHWARKDDVLALIDSKAARP